MKIRTRIFLVFVLSMAVGIFSLVRWMQGEMRPRYMEAQEDTLVDMSQLLAGIISTQALEETDDGFVIIDPKFLEEIFPGILQRRLDAQIYEIKKQHVDIRVYVTDIQGTVIFDSDGERDLNADYSQWRDVHRTLRGDYGARSTELDPMYPDGSTMYIAAPIVYEDEIIGVVSVGKPTRNAERFLEHLLENISLVGLIVLAVAVIIGFFINGWISWPMARLERYANAVTCGERTSLPKLGNNEVGQVGQAMESMRVALDGKSYVSDYVQALTHELKSPIAAIQGAAELIDEDMPVETRRRFMDNIRGESQRMQELIDRLLDLASLEYRPTLESSEKIDINELLLDVIDSLEPVAHSRQVTIQLSTCDANQVRGDPFLLSKAFSNILKNAIEFSPLDSQIDIITESSDGQMMISICDQGEGIPDYAREKVFDRFFSLPKPDGRKGSGLGLSFVKEIAALHQAKVLFENNEHSTGLCVVFVLAV